MVPLPYQRPAGEEMGDLQESLWRLPKAELHQHLDGALRPETAVELAAAIGLVLSLDDAKLRMIAPPRCANQAELLTYFDLPIALLQTDTALRRAAAELVVTLAEERVAYAEIRWAPRLHLERGLGMGAVIEAVAQGIEDAMERLGSSAPAVSLIVTAIRSHPPAANVLLAREAAAFGEPVVGFDLAGLEAEWPAPPHAAAFVAAAEGGLKLTAHAGEVASPEHLREALDLGATRIAHGVTAIDDPELIEELKRRDVTLDMCPTSNVQAGIVADLTRHPLARLHRLGVSVTCSTDDRVVANTNLTDELARSAERLGLTRQELRSIALNAFRRGFGPAMVLERLLDEAEQEWSAWAAEATNQLS
jgi:adenosine deaminase